MAIKRPEPKKISQEEMQKVLEASSGVQVGGGAPKTYDENYPVFENIPGEKVLIYIPNHTVTSPEGVTQLRCDRYPAHNVKDGKMYARIRCTEGIESEALGLDGTCPLCDSVSLCWDVYNKQYDDAVKAKGIDVDKEDGYKAAAPIREKLREGFAVQKKEMYLTFPIVVIECETKDGHLTTIPKRDANGGLIGKPMFYDIREGKYIEEWIKALEGISVDTIITHPAGTWAVLNFEVRDTNGAVVKNPSKRDAGKALSVTYKQFPAEYEKWANYYDELTADWTPAKAAEVLVNNQFRDANEMNEVNDQIMRKTNDLAVLLGLTRTVAIGTSGDAVAQIPQTSADDTLANFGVESGEPVADATATATE